MKKKTNLDSSGTHLWLVLMKAHRAMERHAEISIEEKGLGLSDFAIMEALLHKGPLLAGELGEIAGLTSGSITAALDRLERQDWIERTADDHDRRARRIRLTRKGETKIAPIFQAHRHAMDAVAECLSREERRAAITLLKKLGINAQRGSGKPVTGAS